MKHCDQKIKNNSILSYNNISKIIKITHRPAHKIYSTNEILTDIIGNNCIKYVSSKTNILQKLVLRFTNKTTNNKSQYVYYKNSPSTSHHLIFYFM